MQDGVIKQRFNTLYLQFIKQINIFVNIHMMDSGLIDSHRNLDKHGAIQHNISGAAATNPSPSLNKTFDDSLNETNS